MVSENLTAAQADAIRAANPKAEFDIASNPEFLREGAAIDDFMRPDRVVVGIETARAKKVLTDIYRPLFLRDFPIVFTGLESAEMIKYAANAFLATKITFINEMADLCEKVGADVQDVARGIGMDQSEAGSQDAVWRRVGRLEHHFGTRETNSLLDMMQDMGLNQRADRNKFGATRHEGHNQRRLNPGVLAEVRRVASRSLPGQAGVLVGLGGEVVALELHGNPDVLSHQLQSMLNSILLDANTVEWRPTHGQKARDFAEEIMYTPVGVVRASASSQGFAGVGESADIRTIATARTAATLHMSVINNNHQVALAS